ncbi:unnamed protein product [Lactuca saligna]|uniref:Uncharacterized protein n=1 Tax=Lactuca saligna TaxID=75948 RepID=A0AA36E7V2_LACSI|nr:unnamed protein product [Lactuca saligna]
MVPTKSGVLNRLKKMAYKPHHSPERSSSFSPSYICKPQLNSKGVVFHEIPTPVSIASKKRLSKYMTKRISKKQKKQRKLILNEDSMEDEVVPASPLGRDKTGNYSLVRDSPVKSNLEATVNLDGNVEASKFNTTITHGEQPKIYTPKQTMVKPLGVSTTESIIEEVRTSGITANISNMDANFNKGDGVLNNEAQGNPSLIVSTTFETSVVDTTISLPRFLIPTSSEIPTSTHSPTFDNVMQQPITSLFPSQSTKTLKTGHDDETDDGEFMVSFANIEFDFEEENTPDHMLMSDK